MFVNVELLLVIGVLVLVECVKCVCVVLEKVGLFVYEW